MGVMGPKTLLLLGSTAPVLPSFEPCLGDWPRGLATPLLVRRLRKELHRLAKDAPRGACVGQTAKPVGEPDAGNSGMVQKLAREDDLREVVCVCDAAQCNPLTTSPMGLTLWVRCAWFCGPGVTLI